MESRHLMEARERLIQADLLDDISEDDFSVIVEIARAVVKDEVSSIIRHFDEFFEEYLDESD